MDAEFQSRWPDAKPPFDGMTLIISGMTFAALRNALRAILRTMSERGIVTDGSKWFCMEDWHEHDGFVMEAEEISWQEVESWLTSDEALSRFCPDDTFVKAGIYTAERSFYLRFEEQEFEPGCYLDLSGSDELLNAVRDNLNKAGSFVLTTERAETFFREGYKV